VRLLHTGDWHIGRSIRGRSRSEEFADALREVVGIAGQENVDAVLLAGDVYDHRSPTPEADDLVFEALLRLHEAGIPVVAIAGNHDSPARLAALAKLLRPIGTTLVPRVARPDQGAAVEICSRSTGEVALIACVPFVPERRYGDAAALFDAPELQHQSYAEGVGILLQAMAAAFRPDAVNVLLAHLFTDGAIPGGGEHTITIAAPAVPAHVNHGDSVGACTATAGTNSTATTTQTTTANTTTTTTGHGKKPNTHVTTHTGSSGHGNSGHAGNKAGKSHGGGKGHSK